MKKNLKYSIVKKGNWIIYILFLTGYIIVSRIELPEGVRYRDWFAFSTTLLLVIYTIAILFVLIKKYSKSIFLRIFLNIFVIIASLVGVFNSMTINEDAEIRVEKDGSIIVENDPYGYNLSHSIWKKKGWIFREYVKEKQKPKKIREPEEVFLDYKREDFNKGMEVIFDQLYKGKPGYKYNLNYDAKGHERALIYDNEVIRYLIFDKVSRNEEANIYVLYEADKDYQNPRILDMYAVVGDKVVSSGKKNWEDNPSKEFYEITGR